MESLNALTASAAKQAGKEFDSQSSMAAIITELKKKDHWIKRPGVGIPAEAQGVESVKVIKSGVATMAEKSKSRVVMMAEKIFKRLETTKTFDALGSDAPRSQDPMLVAISQVLRVAEKYSKLEVVEVILEAMEEMQDAFEMCEREYALYPEHRLRRLVVQLYAEAVSSLANMTQALARGASMYKYSGLVSTPSGVSGIGESVERIRGASRKITAEVEYLQRRELREAYARLRDIDRKQDHVIRALAEHRKIMLSLQEEQRVLASVADHQKVLQMLQQLLARGAVAADKGILVGHEQ